MMYVGQGFVIEAIGRGVVLTPLHGALEDATYAAVMRSTKLSNPQAVVDFAFSKLGAKYDTLGVITNPRFGIYVSDTGLHLTNTYFCSSLIYDAYCYANDCLFIKPGSSAPSDIPSFGFLDGIEYIGHLLADPKYLPIYMKQ